MDTPLRITNIKEPIQIQMDLGNVERKQWDPIRTTALLDPNSLGNKWYRMYDDRWIRLWGNESHTPKWQFTFWWFGDIRAQNKVKIDEYNCNDWHLKGRKFHFNQPTIQRRTPRRTKDFDWWILYHEGKMMDSDGRIHNMNLYSNTPRGY